MGNFNRREGGDRFGGPKGRPAFGGKPNFQKKSWGGQGGGDREMFQATCAKCGKPCEVPFRPLNGKPVYCRDCFIPKDDARGDNDRPFSKPRFEAPRFESPRFEGPRKENVAENYSALVKKVDELGVKLDRLMKAVEGSSLAKAVQETVGVKAVSEEKPDEKGNKKTNKKGKPKKK